MILSVNDCSHIIHGGIIYSVTTLLSLYSLLVCIWWWFRVKEVPFFFIHNTILTGAVLCFSASSAFLYLVKITEASHNWILESWWWLGRPYSFMIPMLVFSLELTRRVFFVRRRKNKKLIRKQDKKEIVS